MRAIALAAVALVAAAPASAQNGAMWVDDYGRMTSFTFAGGSGVAPNPEARATMEVADLFKRLCVDSGATVAGVDAAARAAGLTAAPLTMGGGKKAAPVTLDLWSGPGLVVSRADGFLGSRSRQCNATFYLPVLPQRTDLATAVATALGQPPANADKAVRKDGKPEKYWTPEWRITASDGSTWIVTANMMAGSSYQPGNRVQLSARAAANPGKAK